MTTPLIDSFAAFQNETGISMESLARAMQLIAEDDGEHLLFELERGRTSEAEFLERMADALEPELGHRPQIHRFSEIYFDALEPNEPMIELMRGLRRRGYRMALLTNNVREWEPLWRSMLPVDEIFDLIVDSAFVGLRKPEPEIYRLTVARIRELAPELGELESHHCLFVDDTDANVAVARELGMAAVHFRSNEQAVAEIEAALGRD